jgi:hypothetical protein
MISETILLTTNSLRVGSKFLTPDKRFSKPPPNPPSFNLSESYFLVYQYINSLTRSDHQPYIPYYQYY